MEKRPGKPKRDQDDDEDSHGQKDSRENLKTPRSVKKKESDECSTSTAVTSMAHTPMTTLTVSPDVASSSTVLSGRDRTAVSHRRRQLQQQMIILTATTSLAFASFILTFVPLVTLLAFGMLGVSVGLLSYTTFQRLVLEYQEIVTGQGFGQYLPHSWYQQLAEMTLHDFMRDDNFVREWAFMGLYFIPGLSEEQLTRYLSSLSPDHQQFLNRAGLGHFLGQGFMRAMLGEQRWRQNAIDSNFPVIEHSSNNQQQIAAASRRLDFDADETDSQASSRGVVGLTIDTQTNDNTSSPTADDDDTTSSDGNEDEHQRQLDMENSMLASAAWDAAWNYWNWGVNMFGEAMYDYVVEPSSSLATYVGLGVTFLSLGVGSYGLFAGYYNRPGRSATHASSQQPSFMPSQQFLFSTALLGGVSSGLFLYGRSVMRNAFKPSSPTNKKNNNPSKKPDGGK